MAALGAALSVLHAQPIHGLAPFTRLDPDRLVAAGSLVRAARPDLGPVTEGLVGELLRTAPPPGPNVLLHGDLHPKNVLVHDQGVSLVDFDEACAGPAAAELGGLLARLWCPRPRDPIDPDTARAAAEALLAGYHRRPSRADLLWYAAAALLVERAAARSVGSTSPRSVTWSESWRRPGGGPGTGGRTGDDATTSALPLPADDGTRSPGALDAPGRRPGAGLRCHAPQRRTVARGASRAHHDRRRAPAAAGSRRRLHAGQPGRPVHGRGGCPAPPVDDPGVLPGHGSRRGADRAVPVRTQEVRERADAAPRGRALRRPRPLRRLQPARHPGQQPARPAGPRRPREQVANAYFDAVLVHADARFATLEETFHPSVPLRVPVHYTGFVRAPRSAHPRAGAGAAGPRLGWWRTGRRAAVPGGRRGAPAPVARPRAAHRDRDRTRSSPTRSSTSSRAGRRGRPGWRWCATSPTCAARWQPQPSP